MTFEEDVIARLERIEKAMKPGARAAGGAVATDDDLDGQWGDPEVRKDPPRWKGDSFKGKKYSDCPIEFLDALAGFLDWQAGKDDEKGTDDGKKYANYARKDAGRARGWIARLSSGWQPTTARVQKKFPGTTTTDALLDGDDDIPF